ncbi:DUF2515 family protein [Bacillus taeanensis]|uniref:DUF2515 domain-containing protein n=1 Tax=Bacillus taeanensis TaxID=273032 RepID=A0A366XZ44_9BACI|nr:DUF2515 family protein [Bacillus taeanensis]RBW69434.1 DUF2515 domain-containing protein [Bacillus taeanensis]
MDRGKRTWLEKRLVEKVKRETEKRNKDNISRTVCYQNYYMKHQEISWSFLASMVSRNAGWNMTDLESKSFSKLIDQPYRNLLFLVYERANWLIFADAYPQLLIYALSKRYKKPYFYLLDDFFVSSFMKNEWLHFWNNHNKERLCTALIINEQHVIQQPVIEHPILKKRVFHSFSFFFEELFHFSTVLFPTLKGELYGFCVKNFQEVSERIELGKKLKWLLIDSGHKQSFFQFALATSHTGSRRDYQQYGVKGEKTPILRSTYPVIPHERSYRKDWYRAHIDAVHYFKPLSPLDYYHVTDWYEKKENQIKKLAFFYSAFKKGRDILRKD